MYVICVYLFLFFFNDTATTEIYTLSLHDALPICSRIPWMPKLSARPGFSPRPSSMTVMWARGGSTVTVSQRLVAWACRRTLDRKSTRLNSSHANISYAVFCLKKKKTTNNYLIAVH